MIKHTSSSRRLAKRIGAVSAGVALVASGAFSVQTFADEDEGVGPLPPPGEQPVGQPGDAPAQTGDLVLGSDEIIQTSGGNYDPTVLTKYIPANGFQVFQGSGLQADVVVPPLGSNDTCLAADPASGGNAVRMIAPVELPDGARINRVSFYGQDNDPVEDITIALNREEFNTPFALLGTTPISSRERTEIDSFSTSGQQADASVFFGAADLEEVTGSLRAGGGFALTGTLNRFHSLEVILRKAAGVNHILCGARIEYQVAAVADPGTTFHPVEPFRAFDSRLGSFGPLSGPLTPNSTKVIDITDGYDSTGVAIPAQENLVPSNATSITYNITVAGQTGPNFVAVTAGDAASFTASAINYTGGGNIANGSTVTLAADQTIKVWGGDNTGSAHVIIDVTGYSAPVPFPNMGN